MSSTEAEFNLDEMPLHAKINENISSTPTLPDVFIKRGRRVIYCKACKVLVYGPKNIACHAIDAVHQLCTDITKGIISPISRAKSKCNICNLVIGGHSNLARRLPWIRLHKHLQSPEHKNLKIRQCDISENVEKSSKILSSSTITNFIKDYSFAVKHLRNPTLKVTATLKHATKNKKFKKHKSVNRKVDTKQEFPCSLCDEKMKCLDDLHVHKTNHFWSRFVLDSSIENYESKQGEVHLSENPDNKDSESPKKQHSDDPFDLDDLEFMKQPDRKPQSSDWQVKSLDIDIDDGVDIYKINSQKKENLQLGVLLTIVADTNNLYCLICRKMVTNSIQTYYEHLCSLHHMDCIQLMFHDHQKFREYPDELSDLALAYEYMEEVDDCSVHCHVCRTSLRNNTSSLKKHIKQMSHAERWRDIGKTTAIWFSTLCSMMRCDFYSIKNYWCVLCQSKFSAEIEFRKHLYSKKHLRMLKKFATISNELIFDSCIVCGTLWFGFLRTFGYHLRCAGHKQSVTSSSNLLTHLPPLINSLLQSLEDKVNSLVEQIDSTQAENVQNENRIIHDLQTVCKKKYPSCVVCPFGSRVTRLGGNSSDFDIFLECSPNEYPSYEGQYSSASEVEERLRVFQSCLAIRPDIWLIQRVILNARVPIIKLEHVPTKIECDLSFTQGLSVESTKLVKSYCEKFPACRKMIIFIRNWMSQCELTGFNGMHKCAISWMVIFFLQLKGVFPSVAELISQKNQSRLIGCWETGADLDFQIVDIGEPIEKLLAGFFSFYANFDYRNEVVCPLLGRSMGKIDLRKRMQLPVEMKPYLEYLESSEDVEPFRIDSILCIQDPFDLSHNVSKTTKKNVVYKLKSFCSFSAQSLKILAVRN